MTTLLIEIPADVEEKLQHQRLKGEGLADAVARIISDSHQQMLRRGDPREP